MKRMVLLLALLVAAGCTSQPQQVNPVPVQGKDAGASNQPAQTPNDQTVTQSPSPGLQGNVPPSNPCSGKEDLIRQNLRIAAEAKLPMPTVIAGASVEHMVGTEEFKKAHSVEPTPEAVVRQVEQGNWTFFGKPGSAALMVKTPREHTGVGAEFKQYAFDPGSLTKDSPVRELATRFQSELAAGRAMAWSVSMVMPDPGPEKFRVWYGAVDPNRLLSAGWGLCSVETVMRYQNGQVSWVELPLIDLRNAALLGFADGQLVTYSIKSGTYATEWYTIAGIKPLK